MKKLHLTNTLTDKKEQFEPLNHPFVGMYVCGPTVSGEPHLGHARTSITFDVLYRYLTHLNYKVRYVRNITDAGHFEEEGKPATDKISSKSILEKMEPMELVTKYTNRYHDTMDKLNNLRPDIEPTATGHIIEQIDMIKNLIKKEYAYEINGSVYFDVLKYSQKYDYGKLSGRKLEEMMTQRELTNQTEKKNQIDFSLWKKSPSQHIMKWNSPWGEGFPGWHIECSAMAIKYLGSPFDIHGGGLDLIFPHHESEIAQTKIATGHHPAKYWIHSNMLTINGQKMSKSLGNTITLNQLLEKYSPMVVRFFFLQTHYRSTIDFSDSALQSSEKGLKRLLNSLNSLKKLIYDQDEDIDEKEDQSVISSLDSLYEHLNDDLNTALVLSSLFDLSVKINSFVHKQVSLNHISKSTFKLLQTRYPLFIENIMGLKNEEVLPIDTNGILQILINLRKNAKERKDYSTSDLIRNELLKLNIRLRDDKEKTEWVVG